MAKILGVIWMVEVWGITVALGKRRQDTRFKQGFIFTIDVRSDGWTTSKAYIFTLIRGHHQ